MMLVLFVVGSAVPNATAGQGKGGFMGFIAGCCFGVRTAGQVNEGKEIHWREWGRIIPYVNIVFWVWDCIDGAQGVTTTELAAQYGARFY
jgi:hypothetical protein